MIKRKLCSVLIFVIISLFCVSSFAAGMAKKALDLEKVDKEDIDKQILRLGIIAELDAVSLYEQLAANASSEKVKKVMLHTAREEKTHVGEFQALLLMLDEEQEAELKEGEKELKEVLSE